jgi:hypothetical protein
VTRSSFTLAGEGRLGCLEPHELAVKLFENLVAEAGADVADVPPCIVVAYRQHEGAEEGPGSPRRREAPAAVRSLPQPIGGPASGRVWAVGALGHDAFEMSQIGFSAKNFVPLPLRCLLNAVSLWRGRRALSRFLRSRSGSAHSRLQFGRHRQPAGPSGQH